MNRYSIASWNIGNGLFRHVQVDWKTDQTITIDTDLPHSPDWLRCTADQLNG